MCLMYKMQKRFSKPRHTSCQNQDAMNEKTDRRSDTKTLLARMKHEYQNCSSVTCKSRVCRRTIVHKCLLTFSFLRLAKFYCKISYSISGSWSRNIIFMVWNILQYFIYFFYLIFYILLSQTKVLNFIYNFDWNFTFVNCDLYFMIFMISKCIRLKFTWTIVLYLFLLMVCKM